MGLHRNAKLGLAGRFALCRRVERGLSMGRRRGASASRRRPPVAGPGAGGGERGGAAHARLPARSLEPAAGGCRGCCRRASSGGSARRGGGPAGGRGCLTVRTGHPHSTISKVLARTGSPARRGRRASRRAATSGPAPAISCTWTSALYARFDAPGHAVTGDRTRDRAPRSGAGRLRLRARDRRRPLASRLRRAPRRRAGQHRHRLRRAGARLLRRARDRAQAADDRQRLELHAQPLAARAARRRGIRHLTHAAPAPAANGKVERFHQTMAREWAYGLRYRSSRHRAAALPHWLATTTSADHTARSAAYLRSAAFTTSVGRTPSS